MNKKLSDSYHVTLNICTTYINGKRVKIIEFFCLDSILMLSFGIRKNFIAYNFI